MHFKNLLTQSRLTLFKRALSLTAGLVATTTSFSQVDIQVGTGTSTTSNLPINSYYSYSYTQQIYTSAEMNAGSISGPMEISKIRFYVNSASYDGGGNSENWTIYLGHTNKAEFSNNDDWESANNLTNSFSGTVSFPGGGNWLEITLSTPFQYDGTSNLIVGIDENSPGYNGTYYWRKSDLGSNRSIYYSNDNNNPDPSNPPSAGGRHGFVPNIQFEATEAPDCSGTPAMVNPISSEGNNLCIGDSTMFSVDTPPFESQITYQWQEYDGSSWNDISGETLSTFQSSALTASTDYRVVVGCAVSNNSTPSSTSSITVNSLPNVNVDVTNSSFCDGGTVAITASGADTYEWSPGTGLDNTNTNLVNATPSNSTSYTVTGTDANGCVNTATSVLQPISEVKADVNMMPNEICASGSPVTVEFTNLPTDANGGTWNYRVLESDGVTEAQAWGSSNTFTFTPTGDSIHNFYYQLENSSCTNSLDSIPFQVSVGFGAEVTKIDYNCVNMGGSIILSDVFAQTNMIELYNNDLGTGADMTGITLSNDAILTDRLILTPSQTSSQGYAEIDMPSFTTGSNNSFNLNFDITVDLPINNWGTGGADGMCYSFGPNAEPSANGSGHNGKGTGLRLSFDAAGNTSENGNESGIYLVYGWTANNAFGPNSGETIAYSNDLSSWKGQTDVPVSLQINASGKATLTVNGTVIFENVEMPADYLAANTTNWKHLFSATTGGDAERHAISNLALSSGTPNFGISTAGPTDLPTSWSSESTFDNLAPGTYHVWISKDQTGSCSKNIETVIIENLNPIVELGNDTTICVGESLILDAGNPTSTYTWNNTNEVTQTLEIFNEGSYVAYVTDTNGCTGIGTINVDVMELPSANGIFIQGSYPTITFTVTNPLETNWYDWDFGDQTTETNAPSTISHTYTNDGNYVVTATLNNACGSTIVNQVFDIQNTVGLTENEWNSLKIYPNPIVDQFTISLDNNTESTVAVYSLTGATIINKLAFKGDVDLDASSWESGVYLVKITNQGITKTHKIIVQ